MEKYAILANPGHNRVYFEESKKLSIAELAIALKKFDYKCGEIEGKDIEDIFYITFSSEKALEENDIEILSKLSFCYALFGIAKIGEEEYLRPIKLLNYRYVDNNVSSILKYTGKTNELFTKMMLNVAIFSSECIGEKVRVLDPIAGKGTTLFEALVCGYDAYGIEIADKAVSESYNYFRKYLEVSKYKNRSEQEKISGENKSFSAKRYGINFAKNKDEYKNDGVHHWEMVSGNSVYANKYFKKNTFDVIVGDLPYGVQHGNVSNQKKGGSLTRNPKELVSSCLPAWRSVLKKGGAIVLAWNNFVLPKEELQELLQKGGFRVLSEDSYSQFEHRVDKSIKRDIVVAIK